MLLSGTIVVSWWIRSIQPLFKLHCNKEFSNVRFSWYNLPKSSSVKTRNWSSSYFSNNLSHTIVNLIWTMNFQRKGEIDGRTTHIVSMNLIECTIFDDHGRWSRRVVVHVTVVGHICSRKVAHSCIRASRPQRSTLAQRIDCIHHLSHERYTSYSPRIFVCICYHHPFTNQARLGAMRPRSQHR